MLLLPSAHLGGVMMVATGRLDTYVGMMTVKRLHMCLAVARRVDVGWTSTAAKSSQVIGRRPPRFSDAGNCSFLVILT